MAAVGAASAVPRWELRPELVLGALALLLAATWLPGLGKVLAGAALVAVGWQIYLVVQQAAQVHTLIPPNLLAGAPMPAWARFRSYQNFDAAQWARVALAAVGFAGLAALAVHTLLLKRPDDAP